jgi:exoribonuclease R
MSNDSQTERFAATLHVLDRDEVPAGSFRYGQLASRHGFDVAPQLWAVCTYCSQERRTAENEHDGFDRVLVAHFLNSEWEDARDTAVSLVGSGTSVAIVRPA